MYVPPLLFESSPTDLSLLPAANSLPKRVEARHVESSGSIVSPSSFVDEDWDRFDCCLAFFRGLCKGMRRASEMIGGDIATERPLRAVRTVLSATSGLRRTALVGYCNSVQKSSVCSPLPHAPSTFLFQWWSLDPHIREIMSLTLTPPPPPLDQTGFMLIPVVGFVEVVYGSSYYVICFPCSASSSQALFFPSHDILSIHMLRSRKSLSEEVHQSKENFVNLVNLVNLMVNSASPPSHTVNVIIGCCLSIASRVTRRVYCTGVYGSNRREIIGPGVPVGIPRELSTKMNHLGSLMKHLPQSLPLNPSATDSKYHFHLDPDDVKEEGEVYAFNRTLEVCFETHKLGGAKLLFTERGDRLVALEKFFKAFIKSESLPEARGHQNRWIDRLIQAAKDSGAKIPKKRQLQVDSSDEEADAAEHPKPKKVQKRIATVDLTGDDSDSPTPSTSASPAPTSRPSATAPPALRQQTLFQLGCRKFSAEEAAVQRKKHADEARDKMAAAAERERHQKTVALERKRENGRLRQQSFRDRKKTQRSVAKAVKDKTLGLHAPPTVDRDLNVAEVSRPKGEAWKKKRTGAKNGVIQKRHERVNWYHPFLFNPINQIAPRVGWSPSLIVQTLQRQNPTLYAQLNRGTVQKWISKSKRRWSKKTLANVARRHALAGTGRVGILSPYPEVVELIKTKLVGIRKAGICVQRLLTRSVILSVIKEQHPELLDTFKCSESYAGAFLESVMDWSVRHGTRAASHLPDDAHALCERSFFRLVHLVNFYDIPPQLIINMDQTGVMLMIANNKTYAERGARQVDISGRDEKRAYTLAVASTPSGDLLPFQQIWAGASPGSLPTDKASGMADAKALGFHFAFAKSKKKTSHFSTFKSMTEWVEFVLVPYILKQIELLGLDADQKAVLDLDRAAWQKCEVGEFNLGEECLTSKKAKAAYRKYLGNNPDFRKEIEDKIGQVLEIDSELLQAADEIEAEAVASIDPEDDLLDSPDHDTAVPLQRVIKEAVALDIPPESLPGSDTFCVAADAVEEGSDGHLQGGGDAENVWAYNDNGVLWKEGVLAPDDSGNTS
ncbi:hypothetical protein R3P38DRAFT_2813969 [Favolaschia claudopus]|uniref:DDE-1 domain-containing protein n=1 Tax=Favolaschia claudopus TaxID=2862362 RepID=A0AAV9Z4U3_9AGAR